MVPRSGTSESAGLLFRSWNVSEGNAAVLFDFDRNILEAVFEVRLLLYSSVCRKISHHLRLPFGC